VLTSAPNQSSSIIAPSRVGGIIRRNVTFAAANSPYVLTSTIQIAPGVTVEVEPGVVIDGSLTNLMFLVQGELLIKGTESNHVRLIGKPRAFFSNEGSKATAKIELYGVSFEGGGAIMPASGNSGNSTFIMVNCEVVDVRGNTYLGYPGGTSVVQRSSFKNSGGFSVGFDFRSTSSSEFKRVAFTYNLFSGPSTTGYWIKSWAAYGRPLDVIGNSFIGGLYNALAVESDGRINASQNYWGTTSASRIQDMVLDQNDELKRKSIINVSTPLAAPNASAPTKFNYTPTTVVTLATPTPIPSRIPTPVATPTPTPSRVPTPVATPTPTPSRVPTPVATPTPTPSASAKQPTSTDTNQNPSSDEEIEIEAEEDNEPYIEATVVGGKTRFIVGGEPKTKYRVQATLRGKKKTFTVTTNSNGEIAFRSSLNLKNYSVRLLLGSKVLAKTTVR
jgi:hypothetical protein